MADNYGGRWRVIRVQVKDDAEVGPFADETRLVAVNVTTAGTTLVFMIPAGDHVR